jgi:spore maturation protein CgeB
MVYEMARESAYKKILFVGDLNEGTRSLMRARTLSALYRHVSFLSSIKVPFIAGIHRPSLISRCMHKIRLPCDEVGINAALLEELQHVDDYKIIWIDKSPMIRPNTLRYIKKKYPDAILVSVSEDDMYARHNRNFFYDSGLKYYDSVLTTKIYNLHELKTLGAKNTSLFLDSYDSTLHRPLEKYLDIKNKEYAVSFVGTYEAERAKTMLWLGSQGIRIHIFGNGWAHLKKAHPFIWVSESAVYGEEYVEIINKTRINLGFLRKINRDQVTSRTMEIVGAGGFLLAERTERHLSLFKEGKEIECFGSDNELLEKIRFYLANEHLLLQIGSRGRDRAIRDGYDMVGQLSRIIDELA